MEKLRCDEKNCLYNSAMRCLKTSIAINEHSTCVSFEPRKENPDYNVEFGLLDGVAESPVICCYDCDCQFNEEKACHARNVKVGRQAFQQVRCQTYNPKN